LMPLTMPRNSFVFLVLFLFFQSANNIFDSIPGCIFCSRISRLISCDCHSAPLCTS
jgi:hypothetical protein